MTNFKELFESTPEKNIKDALKKYDLEIINLDADTADLIITVDDYDAAEALSDDVQKIIKLLNKKMKVSISKKPKSDLMQYEDGIPGIQAVDYNNEGGAQEVIIPIIFKD